MSDEITISPVVHFKFSLEDNNLVVETIPELDELDSIQLHMIASRCIIVAGQQEGIEKALEKTQNLVYSNRKGEISGDAIRKQL